MIEREHSHIASVVDVVTPNDGITVVLHPNSCQRIVADFIVLINALQRREALGQVACLCCMSCAKTSSLILPAHGR